MESDAVALERANRLLLATTTALDYLSTWHTGDDSVCFCRRPGNAHTPQCAVTEALEASIFDHLGTAHPK